MALMVQSLLRIEWEEQLCRTFEADYRSISLIESILISLVE